MCAIFWPQVEVVAPLHISQILYKSKAFFSFCKTRALFFEIFYINLVLPLFITTFVS